MSGTTHYHERIQRATQQLAQLQARQLLAKQRAAAREKQKERRQEAVRRRQVADLVFLAGAEILDDAELVGALLRYQEDRNHPEVREEARSRGAARMDTRH
ncbi:conjugal transfer protein TraD [Novilysobacter spongiicola]|uniref:Conjugal transfer protein TraD n=1 Tax=Lysobacter spongiicola DSM 21749 TaxID=1122188 RepID=A0A1T4RFE3_9GAMM|nr:conjugal transfer protein TraD [Lysobacter spongiicola]SKA14639.1 Conjugal transfer protein TraD [Lysobacter spongiicola DSM 21749]